MLVLPASGLRGVEERARGGVLAAALCGLAASGHFPREHRSPALRTTAGALILFGSIALVHHFRHAQRTDHFRKL